MQNRLAIDPMYLKTLEQRGSVVECWTQDQGVEGSSLTSVTAFVLEQETFILARYLFNPGINEKLSTGT